MDKDTYIAQTLFPKNDNPTRDRKLRLNVKPLDISTATRKTKLTLCVVGSWAIYMPPYNLARLSSLTREAGYTTRVFDFNVEAHYDLKEANPDLADAWNGANYWWWQKGEYYQRIHPTFESILDEYIDIILADNPDIIGFSCYYTNILPTKYILRKIKSSRPDITLILGGPECANGNFVKPVEADYYFVGESEQNFLDFLNNWENNIKPESDRLGSLYSDTRIDIDSLPYPDYSDFDLSKYWAKNSICAEISRGCVAKCTYCTEVYYWKFRDRGANNVVDELEFQVKKYGIDFVSFVDSLMNGNLKEFRKFCEGLIERKLGITWWGYARCDGRMDLEFYKLMKAAGAQGFNYGIESGSDKVLKLINKKNTVAEINQNIIDSHAVGMQVSACWVIGAPGEDIEAFSHSLNMLWNHRARILAVSPGPGLGDNIGSDYDNREKYNMNPRGMEFLSGWYTLDLSNTRLHRMIRIKLMHIWLHLCKIFGGTLTNVHSIGDITNHYSIEFDDESVAVDIAYEDFDYNIIKSEHGDFANSIMNEVFGLLRMIWRAKGGYEITIDFNDLLDHQDFIFIIDPNKYSFESKIRFKIDDSGNYQVLNTYRFVNFDKSIVDTDGFEYVYESSGKWVEGQKTKEKKIFFIQSATRPGTLPIESCFSCMGLPERILVHNIARNLPTNGVVVDIGSGLGGRASIIANANNSLEVFLVNPHESEDLSHYNSMLNESWLLQQITDTGLSLGMETSKSMEILHGVRDCFERDPTGRSAKQEIIKKFPNIVDVKGHEFVMNYHQKILDMVIISRNDKNKLYAELDFFSKLLSTKGKILVHLYGGSHTETTEGVGMFLKDGWKIVETVESLVVIERIDLSL